MFTIKFNNPYVDQNLTPDIEFTNIVVVDGRETLLDMKQKICQVLTVNPDEVILKRGGRIGVEIKDLSKNIRAQHLSNGSTIYVEFGRPSIPGQFRCLISRAKPTDLQADNAFFVFEDLFDYPVKTLIKY
jgi:hypothetical protein